MLKPSQDKMAVQSPELENYAELGISRDSAENASVRGLR